MPAEYSCGAVVFTRMDGERKYVIIRSPEGFCGFPKGHMEAGETEKETALREIWEETGLRVRLIAGFCARDSHPLLREGRKDVIKHITYFLGEYENQVPHSRDAEVSEIRLLSFAGALASFQYESNRRILREAEAFLEEQNKK